MGLNRNINDDSTLAYLFNKTRQGASDALGKAVEKINDALTAINNTIASIQTALNNKVSKSGDTMSGNLSIAKNDPRLILKSSVMDTSANPPSGASSVTVSHFDKNDAYASYWQTTELADGTVTTALSARRIVNSQDHTNGISLSVTPAAALNVSVSSPTGWRTAIGAVNKAGDTMTGSLTTPGYFQSAALELKPSSGTTNGGYIDFHYGGSTADYTSRIIENASGVITVVGELRASTPLGIAYGGTGQTGVSYVNTASSIITAGSGNVIDSAYYAQWGKVAQIWVNWHRTSQINVTAFGGLTAFTVGTIVSGKRPFMSIACNDNGQAGMFFQIDNNGTVTCKSAAPGGVTSYKINANTVLNFSCTYILA